MVVLIVPTLAPPATACNTPVFRYAMYNWPTAPYYLFYFHYGQIADEDKAINKKIDALQTADTPTNVVLDVRHDDYAPCKKRGADSCVFVIVW